MKLSGLTTLVGIVLILSITACQAKPTPESTTEVIQGNATNTESVDTPGVTFKTLVAGTLTAIAQTMEATDYLTPTETPTITFTPLPTVPPPPTRTPVVVIFTMTGDAYCRKGPGAFYPSITILTNGTVAEILGRDAYNSFVYLQTTDYSCWVSSAYGTVTGNLEMLPIYTPQPTVVPTRTFTPPATSIFSAVFSGLTACGSETALNFTITNTGRIRLESIQVISRIKGDDKKYIHQSDNFTYWSAGSVYQTSLELLPGESAIVSTCRSGAIPYDPTGMKVNSSVTVCSANGLSGSCNTLELEFSPR